jgi:hypothetical protein
MVFATKILYKIFKLDELIGHNVSGKTFNKYIKNKKALDEKRINYIRYLVEKQYDTSDREELWKSCRTAINKSIRNNEIKYAQSIGLPPNNMIIFQHKEEEVDLVSSMDGEENQQATIVSLQPNLSIFQITNDIPPNCAVDDGASPTHNGNIRTLRSKRSSRGINHHQQPQQQQVTSTIVKLTDIERDEFVNEEKYMDYHNSKSLKLGIMLDSSAFCLNHI